MPVSVPVSVPATVPVTATVSVSVTVTVVVPVPVSVSVSTLGAGRTGVSALGSGVPQEVDDPRHPGGVLGDAQHHGLGVGVG